MATTHDAADVTGEAAVKGPPGFSETFRERAEQLAGSAPLALPLLFVVEKAT